VILPFYNAENTLQRAIQSILDQTYSDFELILIDNNSTERSNEIAKEVLVDPRVQLIHEPEQGVVQAANLGMKASSGNYIARMDADDWSYPSRFESQVALLEAEPEVGLVSGLVGYHGEHPKDGFLKYLDWVNEVTKPQEIHLNQFVEYPIVNPSIMFRRELIDKYGAYHEGDFPEDYEFFLRLQQGGVQMKKVKSDVLKWSDLPNRLTRTHPSYTDEAFERVKSKYLTDWLQANNPNFPNIWIWGAGKVARKNSKMLSDRGVRIKGFIEVDKKNQSGDLPVLHFEELPEKPDRFIVSYVAKWGARAEIKQFLLGRGWKEGVDFILAA